MRRAQARRIANGWGTDLRAAQQPQDPQGFVDQVRALAAKPRLRDHLATFSRGFSRGWRQSWRWVKRYGFELAMCAVMGLFIFGMAALILDEATDENTPECHAVKARMGVARQKIAQAEERFMDDPSPKNEGVLDRLQDHMSSIESDKYDAC